jgi:hypothetical protein
MNEELISKLSEAYQTILKLPITAFQDPALVRLLEILRPLVRNTKIL